MSQKHNEEMMYNWRHRSIEDFFYSTEFQRLLATISGDSEGQIVFIHHDQNGQVAAVSDEWNESTKFRITLDQDSTYYFKFIIEFDGASTNHTLQTKFTTSAPVGIGVSAALNVNTPSPSLHFSDNVNKTALNHETPIVWSDKQDWPSETGIIMTIEGIVTNYSADDPVDFIFNWLSSAGIGGGMFSIAAGSGFYKKTGAYYPV